MSRGDAHRTLWAFRFRRGGPSGGTEFRTSGRTERIRRNGRPLRSLQNIDWSGLTAIRRHVPHSARRSMLLDMAAEQADFGSIQEGELATKMRVVEYETVRDEWISARDAQQHTLQWTLAALVVLFAAVLGSKARQHQPELYVGLAFGAGLVAIFSQGIWWGEVSRMERASLFLRGLEVSISRLTKSLGGPPPVSWNTWRGSPPAHNPDDPWIGTAWLQIAGSFCLYLSLTCAAAAILIFAARDDTLPSADQKFATCSVIVLGGIYLIVTAYMGFRAISIWRSKGKAPDLEIPHRDCPEVQLMRVPPSSSSHP